jgi:hypothetical protein
MQIVARLYSAISHCDASQSGQQLVDEAAALYTGSIEAKADESDSSGSGKLLFALAQETCEAFNECNGYDDASLNEFILVSLGDMKRMIDSAVAEGFATAVVVAAFTAAAAKQDSPSIGCCDTDRHDDKEPEPRGIPGSSSQTVPCHYSLSRQETRSFPKFLFQNMESNADPAAASSGEGTRRFVCFGRPSKPACDQICLLDRAPRDRYRSTSEPLSAVPSIQKRYEEASHCYR